MGLFSFIKEAAHEANEETHGTRLLNEVQSTFSTLRQLDDRVQFIAMAGFHQIRERLINEIPNISREGRIKLGKTMQGQAREKFDFDVAASYAKWMGGAWLESMERGSLKAQQAFGMLESFARYIQTEIIDKQQDNLAYSSFEAWLLAFKKAAARHNHQLALDHANKSMIDFMDHEPLKRAYRDGVSPDDLGKQFAEQYDFSSFGR